MVKPRMLLRRCLLLLAVGALATPALGVKTARWTQENEADFKAGKTENVVATNLGDLKLSRALKMILEQDPRISAVYALMEAPDGSIYAATGPRGVLLRLADEKVRTVATIDQATNLTALAWDPDGKLLISTAGQRGRIYRLDDPDQAPVELFSHEGVQYIWAMTVTPDGMLYAATGPQGQLFEIKPDGTSRELLDTDQRNLLSLVSDGKDTLFVGTHPDGLLYRVNRKTGEAFVLYDAQETEISALAIDRHGNIYAGTAQATESTEGGATEAVARQIGRPQSESGVPIPSTPPEAPEPPPLPDPNPGEPDPIPKQETDTPEPIDRDEGATEPTMQMIQTEPSTHPGAQPATGGEGPAGGNAIYRVSPQGFVTEVFRQPVTVLSLLEQDGKLLVGTGSDGAVYQVDPSAEETAVIAKVDPKQVMALLQSRDGQIYLGLANAGGLATMSAGYAQRGTYTSAVLDATQVSLLGKIHLRGTLPPDTTLSVQTRSGNLQEPTERGWSPWSEPTPASAFVDITSPSARFFQYRLVLQSPQGTTTPVVDRVSTSYQLPNLAPRVQAILVTPGTGSDDAEPSPDASPSTGERAVAWQATDPNDDKLLYNLYFRRGTQGAWILLEKDLSEATFKWQTRQVSDGRYYLKVVASDALSNPPGTGREASRISDPVIVDNTPPRIGDLTWQKQPRGVKLAFRVTDQTSTVTSIAYAVDSNNRWQTVLPVDKIADSPEESVSVEIDDLSPGPHQVTIRAIDAHGNAAYETLVVAAGEPGPGDPGTE